MAASAFEIEAFLQAELGRRGLDEVAAVQAAQWLESAGVLADSPHRPGLPLRNLLRAGAIASGEQRPPRSNGRWFIVSSASNTSGVTDSVPTARRQAARRLRTAGDEGRESTGSRAIAEDAGHRVTMEWMGEEIETLADLLRPGLRAVATGINPAPKSVAVGHYYQGNYGQTFFRRLRRAGVLPDGDGFEDDRSFAAGIGFTDVVKRSTSRKSELRPEELKHGRAMLDDKLATLDAPLVIFVFKGAGETLLGRLPPHFYGVVRHRRLGPARVFVMPGPTAAPTIESDAINKLKRALRSAS